MKVDYSKLKLEKFNDKGKRAKKSKPLVFRPRLSIGTRKPTHKFAVGDQVTHEKFGKAIVYDFSFTNDDPNYLVKTLEEGRRTTWNEKFLT